MKLPILASLAALGLVASPALAAATSATASTATSPVKAKAKAKHVKRHARVAKSTTRKPG